MSNNARVTKAKGKWGIESFDASPRAVAQARRRVRPR